MYQKFEKLLLEKNLSVYAVSKETGIPASALYDWKAGRYNPKADKLLALSKFFNVPIEFLLEDNEEVKA